MKAGSRGASVRKSIAKVGKTVLQSIESQGAIPQPKSRYNDHYYDSSEECDDDALNAGSRRIRNLNEYNGYPLLQSILKHERRRALALSEEGKNQSSYPKSNEGL